MPSARFSREGARYTPSREEFWRVLDGLAAEEQRRREHPPLYTRYCLGEQERQRAIRRRAVPPSS